MEVEEDDLEVEVDKVEVREVVEAVTVIIIELVNVEHAPGIVLELHWVVTVVLTLQVPSQFKKLTSSRRIGRTYRALH